MRQVPLERDINIAINGCFGFATSTQKGPFTAMLISSSRGTCLILISCLTLQVAVFVLLLVLGELLGVAVLIILVHIIAVSVGSLKIVNMIPCLVLIKESNIRNM